MPMPHVIFKFVENCFNQLLKQTFASDEIKHAMKKFRTNKHEE